MVGKIKTVGVLALQGAFREHLVAIAALGFTGREVRLPDDLKKIDALIIPGGESTAIARLAEEYQMIEPLRAFCQHYPTWGTCAGLIFLAKDVGTNQTTLGVLDVKVQRNAFGRQSDSFIADLNLDFIDNPNIPFPAVFIRAPIIQSASSPVEILAQLEDQRIIAARKNHIFVTSFHPELSGDWRVHRYFLNS